MPIVNRVADLHGEITAWRREMHMHPELQYDVHRTAASVAEKLTSFGCDEVVPGIGRTGVVGVIRGRKTGSKTGDVVGALTVRESDELMLITTKGQMVRTRVREIRETGRNAMGVKLMDLRGGEKLQAIAPVVSQESEENETAESPTPATPAPAGDG